jgi:hypothetical protein
MNLAGVLDGDAVGGGRPIPCGSACMTWVDMNDDQYNQMRSIFYQYKNA